MLKAKAQNSPSDPPAFQTSGSSKLSKTSSDIPENSIKSKNETPLRKISPDLDKLSSTLSSSNDQKEPLDLSLPSKISRVKSSSKSVSTAPRDAYFTFFVDVHPGKVTPFYSVYLTNWEKLPIFGQFHPGRVYNFPENIHPS